MRFIKLFDKCDATEKCFSYLKILYRKAELDAVRNTTIDELSRLDSIHTCLLGKTTLVEGNETVFANQYFNAKTANNKLNDTLHLRLKIMKEIYLLRQQDLTSFSKICPVEILSTRYAQQTIK